MNIDDALKIADLADRNPTLQLSRETVGLAARTLAAEVRKLRLVHRSNHTVIEYWRRAVQNARASE